MKEATSDVETKASVGSLVHEFGTIAGHIGPTVFSSLSCTGLIPSRSKPTIALSHSILLRAAAADPRIHIHFQWPVLIPHRHRLGGQRHYLDRADVPAV